MQIKQNGDGFDSGENIRQEEGEMMLVELRPRRGISVQVGCGIAVLLESIKDRAFVWVGLA